MSITNAIEPPDPGRALEALDTALTIVRLLCELTPDAALLKGVQLKVEQARADLATHVADTKPAE